MLLAPASVAQDSSTTDAANPATAVLVALWIALRIVMPTGSASVMTASLATSAAIPAHAVKQIH